MPVKNLKSKYLSYAGSLPPFSVPFYAALSVCLMVLPAKHAKAQGVAPKDFVKRYYTAYSDVPRAERLAPFYAEEATIDDPTYDWKGTGKAAIFQSFDKNNAVNHYTWRVDNVIEGRQGEIVVEGELSATYKNEPYKMRFVNIFFFTRDGLILKQYDYFDNADYFKVVEKTK